MNHLIILCYFYNLFQNYFIVSYSNYFLILFIISLIFIHFLHLILRRLNYFIFIILDFLDHNYFDVILTLFQKNLIHFLFDLSFFESY